MSQSLASAAPPPTEPPSPAVIEGAAAKKIEGRSPWRLGMERLVRDRAAMISLGVIILIVLMAIFAPVIAAIIGHGPNQQFSTTGLTAIGQPKGPNGTFLLGTDDLGRDILIRIAYGARISLIVGIAATALTVIIGCVARPDIRVLRRPDRLGNRPVYRLAAVHPVPAVRHLPGGGHRTQPDGRHHRHRLLRLGVRRPYRPRPGPVDPEKEYVEAARALGRQHLADHVRDILPNVMAPIIVYATLLIPVGDRDRGVAVLPRRRHTAADRRLGPMIAEAQAQYQYGVVVPGVPEHRAA